MMNRLTAISALIFGYATAVPAADFTSAQPATSKNHVSASVLPKLDGRVAVLDGRTLWYPQASMKIRLAAIDSCELPQWSFDPRLAKSAADQKMGPVPCGPLTKAWLKRTIGNAKAECQGISFGADGILEAQCAVRGRDLALEMLRVGWARTTPMKTGPYAAAQHYAMSARYGMWATYVLDMAEWREKAVDRTLTRRPLADLNLLLERRSEISPPFADARMLPKRTDR